MNRRGFIACISGLGAMAATPTPTPLSERDLKIIKEAWTAGRETKVGLMSINEVRKCYGMKAIDGGAETYLKFNGASA